jgi:hypothetical protein
VKATSQVAFFFWACLFEVVVEPEDSNTFYPQWRKCLSAETDSPAKKKSSKFEGGLLLRLLFEGFQTIN